MTLSENLVRHLYVLGAAQDDAKALVEAVASKEATLGDFAVVKPEKPENANIVYIQHYGKGGITRSDLIELDNILYVNATAAKDMEKSLKTATIELSEDALEDGVLPKGTYIVRITVHNYVGMSDEDTYFKYGQVTSNGKMTAEDFYKAMAKSLQKNLSREVVKMFEVTDPEEASENIVITEVEQPWKLGTMQRKPVLFDVELVANDDFFEASVEKNDEGQVVATYDWGTVTYGIDEENTLTNSKDIADMEYFCMGERADIYRGIGWPNNIQTEYMVNSAAEEGYNVLDIHYAYVGANESCQKSEKTLTLVAEDAAALTAVLTALGEDIKVNKSANWE